LRALSVVKGLVWLGLALALTLLLLFIGELRRLNSALERWGTEKMKMGEAAYEMEISATAVELNLLGYLERREPQLLAAMEADRARLRRRAEDYRSAAVDDRTREVARQLVALHATLQERSSRAVGLGDELTALDAELREAIARLEHRTTSTSLRDVERCLWLQAAQSCPAERWSLLLARLERELAAAGSGTRGEIAAAAAADSSRATVERLQRAFTLREELRTTLQQAAAARRELNQLLDGEVHASTAAGLAETRAAVAESRRLLWSILLTFPLLAVALWGAQLAITTWFERGIARLEGSAAAIGQGDLTTPLREDGPRELLGLVRAMNSMRQSILLTTVARDALEASEARLKHAVTSWHATFDGIADPILNFGSDLRVERGNRAAAAALGKSERELPGTSLEDLPASEPWSSLGRAVTVASAGSGSAVERRHLAHAGRAWEISATRYERDGQGEGVVAILRETTAFEELRERSARQERQAELGNLLASVAHEVRNPLFSLTASLEAWEDLAEGDERSRKFLTTARAQCDRLTRLMRELLDFGRPASNRLVEATADVVVREVVAAVAEASGRRGVTLHLESEDLLPACRLEPSRLGQAVTNLIENAVAFAPAGSVVDITVGAIEQRRRVEIRVEDRGPGFSEEDLVKATQPFFTRRRGGTGLGLAIAKRVAADHGGTLTLANRAGGGAVVRLTLPSLEEIPA
jgi:signal transduction histidine kinase